MRSIICILMLFMIIGCSSRQSVNIKNQNSVQNEVSYSGGDGESIEEAVIISGVENQSEGMDAEYAYLSRSYGEKNREWRIVNQTLVQEKNKVYDVIEIQRIMSKENRIHYFDVSAFPWKKKTK